VGGGLAKARGVAVARKARSGTSRKRVGMSISIEVAWACRWVWRRAEVAATDV